RYGGIEELRSPTALLDFQSQPLRPADELNMLSLRERHPLADDLCLDRQLAAVAHDQRGERHRRRASVVEELVQRGAYGAAGMQHVVHQYYVAVVDADRRA